MKRFVIGLLIGLCTSGMATAQIKPDLTGLAPGTEYHYFTPRGPSVVRFVGPKDGQFDFFQRNQTPFGDFDFNYLLDQKARITRMDFPRYFMTFEPFYCGYHVGECTYTRGVGVLSRPVINRKTWFSDGKFFFQETLISGGPAEIEAFGCAIIDEFGQELAYYAENGGGSVNWVLLNTGQTFENGETPFDQVADMCALPGQLS